MLYEHDHHLLESFKKPASTKAQDHSETDGILNRIQGRDESALRELMTTQGAMLRSIIGRVIANDSDTADVLQETFLEIWNKAGQFDRAKGPAIAWIVTLARRRAIDRVRRLTCYNRAEERLRLSKESEPQSIDMNAVTDECDQNDKAVKFARIFATLPDEQRQVLELTYYGGLSQRDIAAKTGIPLGTVKTRIELGMSKFRRGLLEIGRKEEWLVAA